MHPQEAKYVAALLGGIDSLIALIKRVNKRYQDVATGVVKPRSPKKQKSKSSRSLASQAADAAMEDDASAFERDMSSMESIQDVYFVTLAALLNISVLRAAQPAVARKGLLVLLGSSTLLYGRVEKLKALTGNSGDEKLLHLVSGIVQNLSMHPQNRTLLYKAELKGSVALDKLIEQAVDIDDELKQTATLLPPIHGNRAKSTGRSTGSPSHTGGHNSPRSPSPTKLGRKTDRTSRISPNGAVLNSSVDTALAGSIRPKVVFPPIVENKEDVWQGNDLLGNSLTRGGRGTSNRPTRSPQLSQQATLERNAMQAAAAAELQLQQQQQEAYENSMSDSVDSRSRFLNWLDNTFSMENETQGPNLPFSNVKDDGRKKHRKVLWDENGDWLDNEPETAKALHRLMCRPLNHLWQNSPELAGKHGQRRWEPTVSHYAEGSKEVPLTRTAQRLLLTEPPREEALLMTAATQMMTTGRFEAEDVEFAMQRPSTRERENGRMGLTVLKPNFDIVLQSQESPADRGTDSPQDQEAAQAAGMGASAKALPLKIALGPTRPRQVISFEDRILVNDDVTRPMLTVFEHVEGSRVCKDMFPAYQLPNGKMAYMYYNGGQLLDEVHVDAVQPPPRPSTVPAALQQTMPLADVLNLIAKPPGSAPPFIPYKPVPYLVPLPGKHTLTVKRPDQLRDSAFGDLREDNLQLIIQVGGGLAGEAPQVGCGGELWSKLRSDSLGGPTG